MRGIAQKDRVFKGLPAGFVLFQTTLRLFHSLSDFGIPVQAKDAAMGLPEKNSEGSFINSLPITSLIRTL